MTQAVTSALRGEARGDKNAVDLVLSSGFLAFAEQTGFLRAVEESPVQVEMVCGTSSGALAGALWCAGMPAAEVFERLTEVAPLGLVRPSLRPWRGLLSLEPVIAQLSSDLPGTFAALELPLAVGVVDADRTSRLLWEGPLPASVAASCAIPGLFAPIILGGVPYADGGVSDRTGLRLFRQRRPETDVLLHLVERHRGAAGEDDLSEVTVVHSPRSGAKLWSLGDVRMRFERTYRSACEVLQARFG